LAPLLLLPSLSLAASITVPTGLLPGAQYRLAFVTAGSRDAYPTSIAVYDAFVQAQASLEPALNSLSWQVIGSTASVSARDHTLTDPTNYPGVPIYLLNDTKLVDDYADLWDGSTDIAFGIDQFGNARSSTFVWTGTQASGVVLSSYPLGAGFPFMVGMGNTWAAGLSTWVANGSTDRGASQALFAISNVQTVPVPEAGTPALITLGFAALLLVRRVRPG
jgi:hypothetical protein